MTKADRDKKLRELYDWYEGEADKIIEAARANGTYVEKALDANEWMYKEFNKERDRKMAEIFKEYDTCGDLENQI